MTGKNLPLKWLSPEGDFRRTAISGRYISYRRPTAAKPLRDAFLKLSTSAQKAACLPSHGLTIEIHPSFLASNSFTIWGLAWPFEAFITWSTKNPSIVFFPARYCSSCLGFAARISSTIFSRAVVSWTAGAGYNIGQGSSTSIATLQMDHP